MDEAAPSKALPGEKHIYQACKTETNYHLCYMKCERSYLDL